MLRLPVPSKGTWAHRRACEPTETLSPRATERKDPRKVPDWGSDQEGKEEVREESIHQKEDRHVRARVGQSITCAQVTLALPFCLQTVLVLSPAPTHPVCSKE
jgi:hypothetical protein